MTRRSRPKRKKRRNPGAGGDVPPFPPPPDGFARLLFDLFGAFVDDFQRSHDGPLGPKWEFIRAEPSPIPVDLYRKLLMLCHPDKHQNSEISTEVTRWLIANDPRKNPNGN